MCFNLHLYFKVFYTNLSFMEQFYKNQKHKTIAFFFFRKFINKTPCRIQIGDLRVSSLVLFPQNMIIQQIIHSGVRSKLKELNDSSKKKKKKNSSKKRHPPTPRGSNAHVYMYACKTKCLIDINNFTRHENLHVVIMDYHKYNIAKAV